MARVPAPTAVLTEVVDARTGVVRAGSSVGLVVRHPVGSAC